jgi:hypothetical protein
MNSPSKPPPACPRNPDVKETRVFSMASSPKAPADPMSHPLFQRLRGESREAQTAHLAIDEPKLLLHAALLSGLQRCRPVLPLRRIHELPSPLALDNMRVRIDHFEPFPHGRGSPFHSIIALSAR